jgi:hypothetical protein
MADRQRTAREETETWLTDRGQTGNRQSHGRETEIRQGRDRDMADRQRTGREESET